MSEIDPDLLPDDAVEAARRMLYEEKSHRRVVVAFLEALLADSRRPACSRSGGPMTSPMLTPEAIRRGAKATLHHGYDSWEERMAVSFGAFLAAQDHDALARYLAQQLLWDPDAGGQLDHAIDLGRAVIDALLDGSDE